MVFNNKFYDSRRTNFYFEFYTRPSRLLNSSIPLLIGRRTRRFFPPKVVFDIGRFILTIKLLLHFNNRRDVVVGHRVGVDFLIPIWLAQLGTIMRVCCFVLITRGPVPRGQKQKSSESNVIMSNLWLSPFRVHLSKRRCYFPLQLHRFSQRDRSSLAGYIVCDLAFIYTYINTWELALQSYRVMCFKI